MNSSIALPAPGRSRAPVEVLPLSVTKTRRHQEQRLAALGILSAGIAHDLNNILAMLRGYLSMARATLGPQHPVQSDLGEVANAAERATSLANRILNFSRPHQQVLNAMDIEAATRDTLGLLRATLPKRIDIVGEFAVDLPAVRGDYIQIQQVLVNLGINAAQAMPDGQGIIRVCVTHEGDYIRLRFSDTGCGMTAATRERIFDPFFSTKPRDVGTGLGLSVVREIMDEHRGSITVKSRPGKGTEFTLFLPVAAPGAAEAPGTGRWAAGRGQRILFLDDDTGFVELAKRVIGKAGYRVVGYSNCAVALAEFAAAPRDFDLVVVDLAMPETDGLDVARSLAAIRADIPIIITAGYITPGDEARAVDCGVREVVGKSATVEELCRAFGRVFSSPG